jgi:Tol biopolymer transport system component
MSRRDALVAFLLTVLVAAFGLAAVLTELAEGSWPGRPGRVVYVAAVKGEHNNEYPTVGLRSLVPGVPGSTVALTSDPSDADPQVSPDGRLVVFSRTVRVEREDPISGLFVMGIDGSGLQQLTAGGPEGEDDIDPAFYPSGQSIVFSRGGDLHSMRLDGSGLRRITSTTVLDREPAVSPTGRQIAFECFRHTFSSFTRDVCSIRPDGTHRRNLTAKLEENKEASTPGFNPSGKLIAFTLGPGTAADVFTMRSSGTRIGALTNRSPQGRRTFPRESGYALPSFAPGGKSLVAVARPGFGPRLVLIPLRDPANPRPLQTGVLATSPAWAPRITPD